MSRYDLHRQPGKSLSRSAGGFSRTGGHGLERLAIEFVMPLTPSAWGNRYSYFRDVDGNLIDFFGRDG